MVYHSCLNRVDLKMILWCALPQTPCRATHSSDLNQYTPLPQYLYRSSLIAHTELAILAKMGRPTPSQLHGLPRALQRSIDKPISRPPEREHACFPSNSSLQHHDGYNNRRRLALHLDAPDEFLRPSSRHAAGYLDDNSRRCRIRSFASFQCIVGYEGVVWVWFWRDDVGWHGVC